MKLDGGSEKEDNHDSIEKPEHCNFPPKWNTLLVIILRVLVRALLVGNLHSDDTKNLIRYFLNINLSCLSLLLLRAVFISKYQTDIKTKARTKRPRCGDLAVESFPLQYTDQWSSMFANTNVTMVSILPMLEHYRSSPEDLMI